MNWHDTTLKYFGGQKLEWLFNLNVFKFAKPGNEGKVNYYFSII